MGISPAEATYFALRRLSDTDEAERDALRGESARHAAKMGRSNPFLFAALAVVLVISVQTMLLAICWLSGRRKRMRARSSFNFMQDDPTDFDPDEVELASVEPSPDVDPRDLRLP